MYRVAEDTPVSSRLQVLYGAGFTDTVLRFRRHFFTFHLRWPYVGPEPVWVLCFLPGILGILLSVKGCRRAHSCEPEPMGESPRGVRNPPHPCALPAHLLLMMAVAVALALHASALLVCEVRVMENHA